MPLSPERQKEQCELGYHNLVVNVATVLTSGLHTGYYYCQYCFRAFKCEEIKQ